MPLIYNFAPHHGKYMDEILRITGGYSYTEDLLRDFDIGVTNSYFGMKTSTKIANKSDSGKIITMGHSMFGYNEHIKNCKPKENFEYFMLPHSWNTNGRDNLRNTLSYRGHYMSLYHYRTRPTEKIQDGILFLLSAQTTVEQIKEHIKNLDHKRIYLYPHPFCVSGFPDGWKNVHEPLGAMIEELMEFASNSVNVRVTYQTPLIEAIDSFEFIMGMPPSSTLIEAIVRGKIWGNEKRIVATGSFHGVLSHYGISTSVAPTVSSFTVPNNDVINGFVIGEQEQEQEILNSIQYIKNWSQ